MRKIISLFERDYIVWWRDHNDPDCDKVKIKRRDFGLEWPFVIKEAGDAGV